MTNPDTIPTIRAKQIRYDSVLKHLQEALKTWDWSIPWWYRRLEPVKVNPRNFSIVDSEGKKKDLVACDHVYFPPTLFLSFNTKEELVEYIKELENG